MGIAEPDLDYRAELENLAAGYQLPVISSSVDNLAEIESKLTIKPEKTGNWQLAAGNNMRFVLVARSR